MKEALSPQKREEIRAIQRAMDEENERVESSQSRPRTEESSTPRTGKPNHPEPFCLLHQYERVSNSFSVVKVGRL